MHSAFCADGMDVSLHAFAEVLGTIGRSCPNLCVLDVRTCQQIDNKIVRDVEGSALPDAALVQIPSISKYFQEHVRIFVEL